MLDNQIIKVFLLNFLFAVSPDPQVLKFVDQSSITTEYHVNHQEHLNSHAINWGKQKKMDVHISKIKYLLLIYRNTI